jgi:hypothetical protein
MINDHLKKSHLSWSDLYRQKSATLKMQVKILRTDFIRIYFTNWNVSILCDISINKFSIWILR